MKVAGLAAMLRNRVARKELYSSSSYWDAKAREMRGDAVSMWPNNHLNALYHAEQIAFLERALPCVSEKRVLDLGCGTGRIARMLSKRGATVTGIDFSREAIELARDCEPKSSIEYRVQSVFNLNDRHSYDLIVSWGCLVMACKTRKELTEVLAKLYRALRPGGRIVLLEPIHQGFVHRVLNMEVETFCDAMIQAGFEVESVSQLHFWPARFALAFISWPESVTRAVYHLGQEVMELAPFSRMGDYKAISASRRGAR